VAHSCPYCDSEFESENEAVNHRYVAHPDEIEDAGKMETGIEGFDQLMDKGSSSGIPKGSSILVEGGPGSGKTIFCLQNAANRIKKGENVLFMSFEEPPHRLVQHMNDFGWEVDEYLQNDQLRIKRYSALDIARSVEALLSEAKRELLIDVKPMLLPDDFEPDFVVIDSLTSIASAFSGEESRFRIYMEQLFRYLEQENITTFLIRETPTPTHIGEGAGGNEEAVSFLSDGIIAIYNAIHPSGERERGIEIVKMRGGDFESGITEMEIRDGEGIVVRSEENISGEYTLT
jgi:RecA-superfamily ATPases implicated in signal transduction